MPKATRLAQLTLAAALVWAAYWSLRLAWADYLFRSGSPPELARAAQLVPFRAEYQAAIGNWQRAVELNPYYSKGWIQLALEAEAAGNAIQAERLLLKAEEIDKLFEPRWALANFYARRDDHTRFWHWTRLAAERSYGDRTGLFRLTMRISPNPVQIADQAFPNDPVLRREFVTFLIAEGKLDDAAALARSLPFAPDDQLRLDLTDRLIHASRGSEARRLWPAGARLLTNGDLKTAPLSKAFDWRLHWRTGIHTTWTPGQLRIELSGKQAESVDLVSQYLWIEERGSYRFTCRYRTEGLSRESGVFWTAIGAEPAAPRRYLSGDGWRGDTLEFRAAKPRQIVRLELRYERAAGTVRQEGIVFLDGSNTLEPASDHP